MAQSSCFRTHFERQDVHRSETLLRRALHHFYFNFRLMQQRLSWETFLLVRFEILGLFRKALTADHMYFPRS